MLSAKEEKAGAKRGGDDEESSISLSLSTPLSLEIKERARLRAAINHPRPPLPRAETFDATPAPAPHGSAKLLDGPCKRPWYFGVRRLFLREERGEREVLRRYKKERKVEREKGRVFFLRPRPRPPPPLRHSLSPLLSSFLFFFFRTTPPAALLRH